MYRNPVREEKSDRAAIRRRMYRNPVRKGRAGASCDRKKNVPESGTRRKNRIKQRSEEECTGIRYAKKSQIEQRSEEECTEIRYAKEEPEQAVIGRRTYRNPEHEGRTGASCDRKKNVPESGTPEEI